MKSFPKKLTWNLDDLLKLDDLESLSNKIRDDLLTLRKQFSALNKNSSIIQFQNYLNLDNEVFSDVERLVTRADLMKDQNQKDPSALQLSDKADEIAQMYFGENERFIDWIRGEKVGRKKRLDAKRANRFFESVPELEFFLKSKRSENGEVNGELSQMSSRKDSNGIESLLKLRELIENDFVYSFFDGEKEITINESESSKYLTSPNALARKNSCLASYKVIQESLDKLFLIYKSRVKDLHYENVELRKFKSTFASEMDAIKISDKMVNNILDICRERNHLFQEFARWKTSRLGIKNPYTWDINAPLVVLENEISFCNSLDDVKKIFPIILFDIGIISKKTSNNNLTSNKKN